MLDTWDTISRPFGETLGVRLFIGNLPYSATEADLRAHFAPIAEPSHVVMPVDRETGRPRGFAFVEFADRAVAEEVIRKFDAQPFQGRNLAVSEARAREDRPPRPPGGGPGGFRGPRPGGLPDLAQAGGGFGGGGFGGGGWRWRRFRTAARGRPRRPSRDRSANFGPPAPPRRLRGKKGQQQEYKPRGPIKEKTGGRIYAVDDLEEEDDSIEIDNVATNAPTDQEDGAAAAEDDESDDQT